MGKGDGFSARARTKARRSAVQALYQWHITSSPLQYVLNEFNQERKELVKADGEYFVELMEGVGQYSDQLDELMGEKLDRPVSDLDPVERSILWISLYELQHQPKVPVRVIINESVELAKMFGAEGSYRYVNSIVDKVARQIRKNETNSMVTDCKTRTHTSL